MCNDFILLFEFIQVGSHTGIVNSLHWIFDAANSNMESTPKHLELHQSACRLSYILHYLCTELAYVDS
jgi:hypothetical protein